MGVLCGLVLSACAAGGDAGPEAEDPGAAPTSPVLTADGEVVVSCGGHDGWPPSVMAEGVPGLLTEGEARHTFTSILEDPRYAAEAELTLFSNGVDVDYRVLRGDDRSLTVGLGDWTERGPAVQDTYVLDLEREGERWVPGGWGECSNLQPVLREELVWARIDRYDARAGDGSLVDIKVSEVECTSGRDPDPYLHGPAVVETDDAVTVYVTSTPMEGSATCPGNPSVERTIELDQPLGPRPLLDGSLYPPSPVRGGAARD